jgi:flagellar biosynthesis/type III secretory pathway M-ring protein FliF/YscJ
MLQKMKNFFGNLTTVDIIIFILIFAIIIFMIAFIDFRTDYELKIIQ